MTFATFFLPTGYRSAGALVVVELLAETATIPFDVGFGRAD